MVNITADDTRIYTNLGFFYTQEKRGGFVSCVVERRRELQFFLQKPLSMAAILCFSQHCLTWNFRAENCRTVFIISEG